jgi:flavin-dependent dehydrogenase
MPVRATKRGAQRTPLERDCDVLICGASFAGLAAARELAGSGAHVMMIDRYEVGERQTSACAMPTDWMRALDVMGSHRQTFDEIVVHTPWTTARWPLPWTFSTFDYRELCALLLAQGDVEFETAKVERRDANTVLTDRGALTAPLILDALGWRRVLSNGPLIQPPDARLSRGLEVHPAGTGPDLELWIDASYVRAGYAWNFPAGDELRIGAGSFWPERHVKEPTLRLAGELDVPATAFQGNWIPHQLRRAIEDGIFFAGDSAGHCLPVTAEGIRTAIYFGLAAGREMRLAHEGHKYVEQALADYGEFSDSHEWKYRALLAAQHAVGRLTPSRAVTALVKTLAHRRAANWSFGHYLRIAPPEFVRPPRTSRARVAQLW